VGLVVLEAFAAFGNGRNVARGNPPQAVVRLIHFLEPIRALAENFNVSGVVDETAQSFERFQRTC
jgi:hypothetical protein